MAEFVRFELDDGSEVLFETDEHDLVAQHSGEPEVADGGRLEGRLAAVAQTAEQLSTSLRSRLAPSEVTLEFGVKVGGEVNWWFFAKNQAEATVKVTLKWSAADASPPAAGTDVSTADSDS